MDYEFDDEPYVDRLEGYVCPACVTDAFLKQALQDARYDAANRPHRDLILFLRDFERDFTQPVARDGRAHAEHAPTQAITEYVRHRLTTPEGRRVDGIVYSSSRDPGSESIVVFAGPEHCGPLPDQCPGRPEKPWPGVRLPERVANASIRRFPCRYERPSPSPRSIRAVALSAERIGA